jgi:signal peptidase II
MPQSNTPARANLTIPITAALSFAVDVCGKAWARQALAAGASQPFIPGFLQFTLTSNTGAAFSLGAANGLTMTLIAATMTLVLVVWAIKRERSREKMTATERFGLGCLLGGAFGNLCDRLLRGRVTDFLEFTFVSFPVFNPADVLIDVGIGLLIIHALGKDNQNKSESAQA